MEVESKQSISYADYMSDDEDDPEDDPVDECGDDDEFVMSAPKEKKRGGCPKTIRDEVYPSNKKWLCAEEICLYTSRVIEVDKHGQELDWQENGYKKPRKPPVCHHHGATNLYLAYKTLAVSQGLKPVKATRDKLQWECLDNIHQGHMSCNLDSRNKPPNWETVQSSKSRFQELLAIVNKAIDWTYEKSHQASHEVVEEGGWKTEKTMTTRAMKTAGSSSGTGSVSSANASSNSSSAVTTTTTTTATTTTTTAASLFLSSQSAAAFGSAATKS